MAQFRPMYRGSRGDYHDKPPGRSPGECVLNRKPRSRKTAMSATGVTTATHPPDASMSDHGETYPPGALLPTKTGALRGP